MILYWNVRMNTKPDIRYTDKEKYYKIVKDYPTLPSIQILEYE